MLAGSMLAAATQSLAAPNDPAAAAPAPAAAASAKPQPPRADGASAATATPTPAPAAADKKAAPKDGEKPAVADGKKPGEAAAPSNIQVERTSGGQKLFRITQGLVIDGQQQKPNAFYVLQRASAPYDWEELSENFLSRIGKAAQKKPF